MCEFWPAHSYLPRKRRQDAVTGQSKFEQADHVAVRKEFVFTKRGEKPIPRVEEKFPQRKFSGTERDARRNFGFEERF